MSKKYLYSVAVGLVLVLMSVVPQISSAASYVEFTPIRALKPAPISVMSVISDDHIKSVVLNQIATLISQGILKLNVPGDNNPAPMPSADGPDVRPFQPVNIQGAMMPGIGSLFTVTQLSADTVTGANANLGATAVSGGLTVEGGTTLAETTISTLQVGALTSDSGAYLSEGGDWVNASSKDLKENFTAVDPTDVLTKIDSLPIYTWNYKKQDASIIHLGPVAEDFSKIFGLGGKDGDKAISTIDPSGVAIAGVQALNKKVKTLEERIAALEAALAKLSPPEPVESTDQITPDEPQASEPVQAAPDQTTVPGSAIPNESVDEPITSPDSSIVQPATPDVPAPTTPDQSLPEVTNN